MALVPRPLWDPLPDPPGPDPALANDFQVLAAGDMAPLELAADQVGVDLSGVDSYRIQSESSVDQLGREIAAGALELQGMTDEAAADNLVEHIERAGQQDDALLVVAEEVATALGEEAPVPEPQPDAPAPTPPPSGSTPVIGPRPRF